MSTLRFLLAIFFISIASAAQAEPKVSIGDCGDADILLEFKGATAKHPLIEELRATMKQKSVGWPRTRCQRVKRVKNYLTSTWGA